MLKSPVDPCTYVDITYFGPYILSSMFLYTGSLKLINNYEDKFIVLQSRICVASWKQLTSLLRRRQATSIRQVGCWPKV